MGPRRRLRRISKAMAVRLTVAAMARRGSGGLDDDAIATARETARGMTREVAADAACGGVGHDGGGMAKVDEHRGSERAKLSGG